jgi:hypothetical protein
VGPLSLGLTRAHARKLLKRFKAKGPNVDDFCLYAGWGIRVAYASSSLVRSLKRGQRKSITGRVVLALTANPFYSLNGVTPGASLASASARLKLSHVYKIGLNDWYVAARAGAVGLLKVRGSVVQEVGLANSNLTRTPAAQRAFLRKFNVA